MKRLVLKFGGTSVGTIEKIKKVASIIKQKHIKNTEVIAVVSAMSNVTNDLKEKSSLISKNFDAKELDVLLSSEEQVSSSLLAGALIELGLKVRMLKMSNKSISVDTLEDLKKVEKKLKINFLNYIFI